MVGQQYAAPLVIEVTASRLLRRVTVASVALGLLAIGLAGIPVAVRIGTGGLLLLYTAWIWRRPELGGGPVRLVWDPSGAWWWHGSDDVAPLTLCSDSVVTPRLIVLTFRTVGRRVRSVVLLPGSADAETLRRLRVRLRLAATKPRRGDQR